MSGEGGKKERERNIHVLEIHLRVASHMPPSEDLAHNPDMCPDQELNWQPSSSQAGAQSPEPHQPKPLEPFLRVQFCDIKYIYTVV